MPIHFHRQTRVRVDRRGGIVRRDFLRGVSAAAVAAGTMNWTDRIALASEELRRQGKACILLWMAGGPSQFETFDPKPGHENGGQTKAIATAVPGIQIAETMPRTAGAMRDLAIIRSMTSKEGNHARASFLLHHGYLPTANVKYPTLGSNVAHRIGDAACELPSFVRIGGGPRGGGGAGFLGVEYDPFVLQDASRPPNNTQPTTDAQRFGRRLELLGELGAAGKFGQVEGAPIVHDHYKLIERSAGMIQSPEMQAFDLEQEPADIREAYGDGRFAAGCLLARRLVEAGVTFIEVTSGGWDTHQDNFERTSNLTAQIDQPMAELLRDLKDRGLLASTLVVWMGEFGRTPRINARAGRDHFPRAFSAAVAGCGVQGGQAIGATDAAGESIVERPVTVNDLFRSIYHALGIDADAENTSSIGRPIKLVDGGDVVEELFA
jgi:hypothetical protein